MNSNLQHEDLLIKLRAKLNEEKIKLWEPPYIASDDTVNQSLKDLAAKYSAALCTDPDTIVNALHELQLHSLDRSKANAAFKETGFATFRVKTTVPGEKAKVFKIQKKLNAMGSEMISVIAAEIGVVESRVKLIFNGKVVKPTPSLEEQGLKNGVLIMALIMTETPEQAQQQDTMYMEMKQTRDDATLLSECVEELADDEEYMKLEDQSGKTVELPPAEKRSLLVGLALHEKGRAHAKDKQYSLALVLLLEADRQLGECRSSILKTVDNWAVLQLDIAWCYLCLQSLPSAADAAQRLHRAEQAFRASYGQDGERLVALKGNAANERVLFMRLYLLQGIVAYHQNKRTEAKRLLDKAEEEINALRVDEAAVTQLMELGWSAGAARAGLRAAGGEAARAHHYLAQRDERRDSHRRHHDDERQKRILGVCADGTPVRQQLVSALVEMGHRRRKAALALRLSNNHAADAVRILQEQPELLVESDDDSSEEFDTDSPSSRESLAEPDEKLVTELVSMGYEEGDAKLALSHARNHISGALDILAEGEGAGAGAGAGAGGGHPPTAHHDAAGASNASGPSTSSGAAKRRHKKHKSDKKRKEREEALNRLSSAIKAEAEEYLDTSLVEEEDFLAQYKSLL